MALSPPLPNPFPRDLPEAELRRLVAQFAPDPLNDADGCPMEKFKQAASAEQSCLIDPYHLNPEPYFKWVAEPTLREVSIAARNNNATVRRTFETTERHLGLNRAELKRVRWLEYEKLEETKKLYEATEPPVKDMVKQLLKLAMSNKAPFAAMARYFVCDEWQLDVD
jgi:hypothetical protein